MQQAVLSLKDLCTGYKRRKGVVCITRNLTADLMAGQLVCLIGKNGAGKSTLLRTLAGFQPPLSGHIEWLGREMVLYTKAELSRLVGVVLTERCPSDRLTVRETVEMGRMPYTGFWGALGVADRRIVEQALADIGIERLADRRMGSLSDGERQKVMIAKVLAQETPVIFLDEPIAFLDFPSKVETLRLLGKLAHHTGKTIFLSIHDLELAMQTADTLWVMDDACRVTIGTPRSLAQEGAFNQFFTGEGVRFDAASLHYSLEWD